ncbi:MAG: YhbY family RNA-binding protein [Burkholderiales bacterium]|jgi:putative YhbY family RNA-binding protein|nr:YhbY family RNA-binding protein [Burkholderiales bacterium]
MLSLTPAMRRELRARAHPLHPVVAIGHAGLTPPVLHEIDVALTAHELVKVRAHSNDRDERERFLATVCETLDAAPVQHLGKLLIVWRPKPEPSRETHQRRPARKPGGARRQSEHAGGGQQSRRRGPPKPQIGARASKHRRGAARHAPDAAGTEARAQSPVRRKARSGAPEPKVPTTSAPRGARYSQGRPVGPQNRRRSAPKDGAGVAERAPASSRRRSTSAKGDRRATPGALSSGAPASVRRRRRPAGGR